MCRYAFHTYKEPFACFDCRKVFKQTSRWELPPGQRPEPGQERIVLCPQCRQPMADMGHDFKAPKSSNIKQWEKLRILYEHGFNFFSCGCCGPGYRPAELQEVYTFIQSNRPKSDGERLLERIMKK
ncbi:MAG: hypothetical protein HY781_03195 [Chloroflexi bacterium]|nr:hypothetical protein [Chloroflexota bacterium]